MNQDPPKSKKHRWDKHYSHLTKTETIPAPAKVLTLFSYLLPCQGKALDLACGLAGNAFFLAQHGLRTHAWDSSESALQHVAATALRHELAIRLSCCDIEIEPLQPNVFDVIVVSRFLYRPLCADIMAALRPNGLVFYQTFIVDKVKSVGPTDTAFLLQQNELLQLFSDLTILAYQELGTVGDKERGLRNEAMLVAQKQP